jgi:hypothetical protein
MGENLAVVMLSVYYCGALMSTGLLLEKKVYKHKWGWLFVAAAIVAWPLTWVAFGVFVIQRQTQFRTYSVPPSALHEFVTHAIGSFRERI